MRLRYCGVRGSTPAPGFDFCRVGGHTSCVAVTHDLEREPRLILDAGTGIRSVSDLLHGGPFRGAILLTHLHWDHVNGLPFFSAADRADARVRILLPEQRDGLAPIDTLRRSMSPPHFPIGPEDLRGCWTFESLNQGRHEVEGFALNVAEIPHKGGRTFGYRVSDGRSSFAYLPDHRPAASGPARAVALALCDDADLVIHDAQFLVSESAVAQAQGHATIDEALTLAAEARAAELALFHHSPARTDHQIEEITARLPNTSIRVSVARDGVERSVRAGERFED